MEKMLKELKKEKIDSVCSIVASCIDPRIQRENTVRKGCHYYKHIIWAWRGTGNAFYVMNRTLSHHQKYLVVSLCKMIIYLQTSCMLASSGRVGKTQPSQHLEKTVRSYGLNL